VPAVHVLAASSLYIYVIHWQVLEHLWGSPVPAFAASLAMGVAYWWVWSRGAPTARRALRGVRRHPTARRALVTAIR
jgi:hypothetical protein